VSQGHSPHGSNGPDLTSGGNPSKTSLPGKKQRGGSRHPFEFGTNR
jgi:hypothetical protein